MTLCHMHKTKKTNTPRSRHKFIFTSEFVGSFLFVCFLFLHLLFALFFFRFSSFLDKESSPVAWSMFRHSRRLSTDQHSPNVLHSPSLHAHTKEKTVRKKNQVVKAFDLCFFSNTGGPQRAMTVQTGLRFARDLQLQMWPNQDGEK